MKLLDVFSDKKFLKTTITLAFPIALQNFILSSLNLVDNILIGGLGENAIASVGLANQYFFLLNLVLFGTVSGASIFTAQYWGDKDLTNIKRVMGLSLIISIIFSALFMLGAVLFPEGIISMFSNDSNVIEAGAGYLRISSLSYIFTGVTFAYSSILRSVEIVKVPVIISVIALGINTILNILLVYGVGDFQGFGINGSAAATLIARIIEFISIVVVVYKFKYPAACTTKDLQELSFIFIRKFFKVTLPVILNESIWALGVTVYAAIYAHMGTDVIAATNIVGTIERFAMVLFFGFGNAAAIMIGNKIGEGDESGAYIYAKRFIILNTFFGVLMGVMIYIISPVILSFYNISPFVYRYTKEILFVLSIFLWIKFFNYTNIVGVLRSGGDTKYCLLLDMGGMWLVGVPLVAFSALYLKLPIQQVYIFVFMEEMIKLIIGIPRIVSKKWINNFVAEKI